MTFKNSTAQKERAALVATMREVGPERSTLCGDWTTRDLAAHLVIRERRLDAAPGILIPKFADYTERVQSQLMSPRTTGTCCWIRSPPGRRCFSPFKLHRPAS